MDKGLIAKASVTVNAPVEKIWEALTDPQKIKRYFFGSEVVSDWTEGSPILWKGIWKGKPYEDKGTILKVEPTRLLQYSHFSPLSGVPDLPENYHTLTYELFADGVGTSVTLSQDNNANEEARGHSQKMWQMMLAGLKETVEKQV